MHRQMRLLGVCLLAVCFGPAPAAEKVGFRQVTATHPVAVQRGAGTGRETSNSTRKKRPPGMGGRRNS